MSINDSKIEFIEDGQLTDLAGGKVARKAGIGCRVLSSRAALEDAAKTVVVHTASYRK